MNIQQTGKLIRTIRTERGITRKQLKNKGFSVKSKNAEFVILPHNSQKNVKINGEIIKFVYCFPVKKIL